MGFGIHQALSSLDAYVSGSQGKRAAMFPRKHITGIALKSARPEKWEFFPQKWEFFPLTPVAVEMVQDFKMEKSVSGRGRFGPSFRVIPGSFQLSWVGQFRFQELKQFGIKFGPC
jgi:hypothetical protein